MPHRTVHNHFESTATKHETRNFHAALWTTILFQLSLKTSFVNLNLYVHGSKVYKSARKFSCKLRFHIIERKKKGSNVCFNNKPF